ncbi:MAG: methyl-accepting chemotaxis protein, partial [Opitutales bacterium]
MLNNNLRSSSSELKTNVESELNSLQAQNAVSDIANAILSANSPEQIRGLVPAQEINKLDAATRQSIDKALESNLANLYKAKTNYLTTRESLNSNMAAFLDQAEKLSVLVGESVNTVRDQTIAEATRHQKEISDKTDSSTRTTLTDLSSTANSTLDDTVLILQLRGSVLELEVAVDKYMRAPGSDNADNISKILDQIGESFGKIPENVAGPFEVAAMDTLKAQAEELLTGKNGIVKQAVPSPQSVKELETTLAELDGKLLELADNTVFDGANNLSNYLQQVTKDLSSSLGTLIQTQADSNTALGKVSALQQSTTSIKESLYKLLFLVQDASFKCTRQSVDALKSGGGALVASLRDDKDSIVATLGSIGETQKAAAIDAQLGAIIEQASAKNGIIAQTVNAASAYNQSLAESKVINDSLAEANGKSASSFRMFTDRITNAMQDKVAEGGFWMKVQLWLVVFIFAAAIGLGLWIGATVAKRLGEAVIQLFGLSQKLSASSASLTESSEEQATMASEQAASLEESSSTVEEISSMASRNNDAVREATEISADVMQATEEGTQKMQAMSSTIDQMNTASTQIGKIIRAIDEIAFQTNILALNAAVEAARAGEAGAGFAVVADEVRALALKCKNAAHETEQIIAHNNTLTKDSVTMCGSVAESLDTIKDRINHLDSL